MTQPFDYLTGKDQVSVGVVAVNFNHSCPESSDSVYPLAIAALYTPPEV